MTNKRKDTLALQNSNIITTETIISQLYSVTFSAISVEIGKKIKRSGLRQIEAKWNSGTPDMLNLYLQIVDS